MTTIGVGVVTPIPVPAPTEDATRISGPPTADSTSASGSSDAAASRQDVGLKVGHQFGSRYHILRLLGVGGMGAVYQAWDQVLEVTVALKVIRPESAPHPGAAETLERRFKHELLLARQVTHKNVLRIHDLGEIEGITYISMPYVQGSDLATILGRDGRLPVDRALGIARDLASGLAAAHEAGVVHRDLKPANIMVDTDGTVLIMDFGIARSTSGATAVGMTASGVIVGTVEYMAPEQAKGEPVDARADIYSFGLILNDILLGRRQSSGSGMAGLMARMQQVPASLRSIDATIPDRVDALVTRCLQPDPALRFQSMNEVLAELDRLDRGGHTATVPSLGRAVTSALRPLKAKTWIVAACLTLAVAAAWVVRDRYAAKPAPGSQVANGPTISLAILPFRNASGDVTLDSLGSSLSEVLRTELGQSSHVRAIPSDRLHQVLQDLRIVPNATLTPTELARVADFASARSILWGQLTRFGDAIRIDATLQDLERGQTLPLNAMAANQAALLPAIAQLADAVRQNLARGSRDTLKELKATSWTPSTSSFEALRLYNEGRQLTQRGNHQAALKSFEAATKQDDNFALAFSALAKSYATQGYDSEAAQSSRRAMSLSESLRPQERYLISANHYQIVNDTPKAIEAYENLVKASPDNLMVQFDLGGLYERSGNFERAEQLFAKVVELDPKFGEGQLALGRTEIRRGNPQASLEHLNTALSLAIELDNDEARANTLQAIGVAYKLLARPQEALKRYEESLEIKRKIGDKRGMAASLSEIAQVQGKLGNTHDAEQSLKEALKLQREIGDSSGVGSSLINLAALMNQTLGRPDEALPLLREALKIRREAGNQNAEALVLSNLGSVYLAKGQFSDAQTYFERALELREKAKVPREIADTLHNLAETLLRMGRYDQALAHYLRALELRRASGDRRAAAIESYSIGTIFDHQARYGAAVKSKEEALTAFRDLKQHDMWLGEILSGYGNSLSLAGRSEEVAKSLEEAMAVARELQNPILIAQTLRFQADRAYRNGDAKEASRLAEQALEAASHAPDRSLALLAQASVAMTAAAAQPTKALATRLGALAQEAEALGLMAVSVDCSIQRAETLLRIGDRSSAQREADHALAKSETLGLRLPTAKAHYLRAAIMRLAGEARASREYAVALRLFDEIKNEDGNRDVLKRADLGAMYEECVRRSKDT